MFSGYHESSEANHNTEIRNTLILLLLSIILLELILASKKDDHVSRRLSRALAALREKLARIGVVSKAGWKDTLDRVITATGYSYDPGQDIFFSHMGAWQRKFGYCRLYDEALVPLSMIIDCEPVYFEYAGKRWMIEMWKGQYALTTGCEIGIYATERPDINIPGMFSGTFYYNASDSELLEMSCCLKKNGETLFTREDKHWWLTGFILGEFSEPSELTQDVNITLKDEVMCNAFVKGLMKAGYTDNEIINHGNTVSLEFGEPRTPQPITRTPATDWVIQRKNELLCNMYQKITETRGSTADKLKVIEAKAPDLYEAILNMGKPKLLYGQFEIIKNYL